jgi:hypothetical protein
MAITISGSGITSANIADGTITTDDINSSDVKNLKSGRKNLIINGGFDVWQRGTTFTGVSNGTYAADRWVCLDGVGNVVTNWTKKTTSDPFTYIERTSGSNTAWGLHQFVEMTEAYYPAGTTFTVSADIKHVSGDDSYVFSLHYRPSSTWGSATWNISSSSQAAGTTGTRLSAVFTLPTDVVSGDVCVKILPTSTNNGQKFGARNVQLELGSVATDFEHRSYGEELALCQRYYWRIGSTAASPYARYGLGYAPSTTLVRLSIQNEFRTIPSLSYSGNFSVQPGTGGTVTFSVLSNGSTSNAVTVNCNVSSVSSGDCVSVHTNNDTDAYLALDAEL